VVHSQLPGCFEIAMAVNLHIGLGIMTAGVQSFEPGAAYLPSPSANPCVQGKTDSKGTGTQSGDASDFQSEMDLQDTAPEPKSTGRPLKGSAKNAGKKQNALPNKNEAPAAPVTATPAQVVEPQRHVLPITFAPAQPDETADDAAQADTSQGEATQETVSQEAVLSSISKNISNNIVLQPTVSQNVIPAKESAPASLAPTAQNELISGKTGQNDGGDKNPTVMPQKPATIFKSAASDAAREVAPPKFKDPQPTPQPAAGPLTTIPVATNPIVTDPIATNQPAAPSQPRSYEIQPVSQPELKVPELTPLEPAQAAATQKVEDAPVPASPSALAFAARLTAVQSDKAEPTIPKILPAAMSGSEAPVPTRIPVRYAATAQIIQRAEQKSEGDLESQVEPAKFAGPAFERSASPDFVVPGSPAASDTAKNSQSQPTPEPLPTPRTQQVIEPPAAPPTSSRDIRVQVPDNNGGSTQVRFLETGGEVRVSVRTADTGLAQSLRSHLNDLSLKLAEGGVPAEIWKPAPSAAASQNHQHQPDREGRGSEGRHSGSHSGGHAGSQGDQQDQQDRPAWLEEMEASLLARK
jgi:hypothetical protein